MIPKISKVKGIHPGAILKREIKNRGLKNKDLADRVNEHPQTISAILNEKRGINPKLSIKLGQQFNVADDYFMLLQASYDVKNERIKVKNIKNPAPRNIRKVLFWDTAFEKIDWVKNKKAVIKRLFERGNEKEIQEICNFYGKKTIEKELKNADNDFLPSFKENKNKYLDEAYVPE